jgi:DNA-binding ferritin-like protein (Dps family)
MNVRISKHRRDTLAKIASLSDEDVKTLFGALAQFPPDKYGPSLPADIAQSLASSGITNVSEIVDTILSLFPLVISSSKSVGEVIGDIVAAVSEQSSSSDDLTSDKLDHLRLNLSKLLRVPSMCLGAKATSVLFENERNYLDARVLTDMRPVFELETPEIGGAIITHTLKIEYASEGNGEKEFFVSLSSADVESLIKKLQRAQEKSNKLEKVVELSSLVLLKPEFS